MIQRTLGDILPACAAVAGGTGMPVTNPLVVDYINLAIQELMNEGAFPGVVDRWKIRSYSGKIVLPPELDMLLEFTVDGVPNTIMSPWAEFVNYGPAMAEDILPRSSAYINRTWWGMQGGNLYDRGELPVYTEIPVSDGSCGCPDTPVGPWNLRVYASVEEAADIYMTVQGLKWDSGEIVRTQVPTSDGSGMEWTNGERIPISNGSSFFESTEQYSKVTVVTKPETNSYVRLTAWNGTDEIELSKYAPWETTPSYHHYFSPQLCQLNHVGGDPCLRVVLARARKRFVPVEENTDILIIGNSIAIQEMMIAQWKRQVGALDEYAAHKQTSIDLMNKESLAYTGKVRMPALTFQRGYSVGTIAYVR